MAMVAVKAVVAATMAVTATAAVKAATAAVTTVTTATKTSDNNKQQETITTSMPVDKTKSYYYYVSSLIPHPSTTYCKIIAHVDPKGLQSVRWNPSPLPHPRPHPSTAINFGNTTNRSKK